MTQNSVEHKAAVLTELVFHQYLKRYTNYNRYKISLTKSCDIAVRHGEEILLLANKAERLNQFNLLIDFLKLGREKRLLLEGQPASKKFKSVLKLEDQAAFLTAAAEFIESIEGPKLSLHEAKQIKSLGQNHDNFIAPISQRDHRFIYTHNNYSLSQEKRKELEQLQETLSKEDFRIARQEARVEAENASKLRALKILEDQVRQYIEWARSQ